MNYKHKTIMTNYQHARILQDDKDGLSRKLKTESGSDIEKALDHFFKELKHTPGPWWKPPYENAVMTIPRGDIKIAGAINKDTTNQFNNQLVVMGLYALAGDVTAIYLKLKRNP